MPIALTFAGRYGILAAMRIRSRQPDLGRDPVGRLVVRLAVPAVAAQIINLLQRIQKERQISYLFIAHDLGIVKHISHRIGVMYLGSLVEVGESNSLYREPMHPYTKALLSAIPIPDPRVERSKAAVEISGELPSPLDLPSGCAFRTRCPFASERCAKETPQLRQVGDRQVACFLYEK